jgi:hypothetical protein
MMTKSAEINRKNKRTAERPVPRSTSAAPRGTSHEALRCLSSVSAGFDTAQKSEVMCSSKRSCQYQPASRAPAFPQKCSQTRPGSLNSGDVDAPRSASAASRGESHEAQRCLSLVSAGFDTAQKSEVMCSSKRSYQYQPASRAPAFPQKCSQTRPGSLNSGDASVRYTSPTTLSREVQ